MSITYHLKESYEDLISSIINFILTDCLYHPSITPNYSPKSKKSLFHFTSYYPYILPSDLKDFLEHYVSQITSKSIEFIDDSSLHESYIPYYHDKTFHSMKIDTKRYVDESNIVRKGKDNIVFLYGGEKRRMELTQIHKIYFFSSVDGNTCYFPLFKSHSLIQEFYNGIIKSIFKIDMLSLNKGLELDYSKTIAVGDFWKIYLGSYSPKDDLYKYLRSQDEAILYKRSRSSDKEGVETNEIMYFLDEHTLNYSRFLIFSLNTPFYLRSIMMRDPKESNMYNILRKVIKRFFYRENKENKVINLANVRKSYHNT